MCANYLQLAMRIQTLSWHHFQISNAVSQISTTKQNKGHFQNFWSSCLTPNSNESIYVFSYLLAAVNTFRDDFKFWPEKLIEGINGRGPVNFAIEAYNGQIVGMMEVKKRGLQESGCTECWNLID